jgi:hypothetical protein
MLYLSGVIPASSKHVSAMRQAGIGFIGTPNMGYKASRVSDLPFWAADTGLYSANGERAFDLGVYLSWLDARPRLACLFATAPDKVGDAAETLRRSLPVLPLLRLLGYRAAFVAQDGIEASSVPWSEFDCLFIGGTDEFKWSRSARGLVQEAKRLGRWVHCGRINSWPRFQRAKEMGCDSADGTYIAFGPDLLVPKLLRWVTAHEQLRLDDELLGR